MYTRLVSLLRCCPLCVPALVFVCKKNWIMPCSVRSFGNHQVDQATVMVSSHTGTGGG